MSQRDVHRDFMPSLPTRNLALEPAPIFALLALPAFAKNVAERLSLSMEEVTRRLADLRSEAELALRLLASVAPIDSDARILEVGAGAGVVASILFAARAHIFAIEPLQEGFGWFDAVRAELLAQSPSTVAPIERLRADDLTPERHGTFDLIFSVNVLEHCQPLAASLDALAAVLAPGGRMIHSCPNYRVPYEPHYAMPLVPVKPALTARFRPQIASEALWQSLNFITARDVQQLARRHNLDLTFHRGVLGDAVARLARDPAFARRQGWAGRLAVTLERVGAVRVLSAIPPTWLTPMIFEVARPR